MATTNIPKEMWAELDDQPLRAAPLGIMPDFEHPEWHGLSLVISASICIPSMLLLASLRIYSKCYITRKWSMDDNVFLVSLVAAILYIVLALAMNCFGAYGYHAWEVKIGQLTKPVLMRSFTFMVLSGPLVWLIKLSIFSLIFHAFRPLAYIRRLVYAGIVATGLYHLGSAIAFGVICGPKGGHDRISHLAGMASRECGDPAGTVQVLSVASGAVNLICDLYLLVLPLPAISKLNLPRGRKTGVMLIFLTGTTGCVMSALTLFYRRRTYGSGKVTLWNSDVTYTNIPIMTVTVVECTVGVMIPCMASCAKVFRHTSGSVTSYFTSRFSSFRYTSSLDDSHEKAHDFRPLPQKQNRSHLDTIDRMLMQFKTSFTGHISHSDEGEDKNMSQGTELGELSSSFVLTQMDQIVYAEWWKNGIVVSSSQDQDMYKSAM